MFNTIRNTKMLFSSLLFSQFETSNAPTEAEQKLAEAKDITKTTQESLLDFQKALDYFSDTDATLDKSVENNNVPVTKDVQELLALASVSLGDPNMDPGKADGWFGEDQTEPALNAFLVSQGLEPNGVVTQEVYMLLIEKSGIESYASQIEAAEVAEKEAANNVVRNFDISDRQDSDKVEELQKALKCLEYDLGSWGPNEDGVDGDMSNGGSTERAYNEAVSLLEPLDESVPEEESGNVDVTIPTERPVANQDTAQEVVDNAPEATLNPQDVLNKWTDILNNIPENGPEGEAAQRSLVEAFGLDPDNPEDVAQVFPKWGIDGKPGTEFRLAINKLLRETNNEIFMDMIETPEFSAYSITSGDSFETGSGDSIDVKYFDHIQQYFQAEFGVLVTYGEIMLYDPQTGETFDVPDGPYDKVIQNYNTRNGKVVSTGARTVSRTAEGRELDALMDRFYRGELAGTLRNNPLSSKDEVVSPLQRVMTASENPIEESDIVPNVNTVEVQYPSSDNIVDVVGRLLEQNAVREYLESIGVEPTQSNWEEIVPYLYQEVSGTKMPIGDKYLIRCGTSIGLLQEPVTLTQDPEVHYNGQPCGGAVTCPAFHELPPIVVTPPKTPEEEIEDTDEDTDEDTPEDTDEDTDEDTPEDTEDTDEDTDGSEPIIDDPVDPVDPEDTPF